MDEFTNLLQEWLSKALKKDVSIKHPWDALELIDDLDIQRDVKGVLEPGITIDGPLVLGSGSLVKSPCRIEGPVLIGKNVVIGPNAFIRGPAIIGHNCRIGSTEVKRSILMDGVAANHFSYIGDSILGPNCNLGAGTKIANWRFDEAKIKVKVGDEEFDSGMDKLGAILEENVKTGCNAVLNPGTYISKNAKILPNSVVSRFVK